VEEATVGFKTKKFWAFPARPACEHTSDL